MKNYNGDVEDLALTFTVGSNELGELKVRVPVGNYIFKITIETLEEGVKYAESYQWRHQNDTAGVVLVSVSLILNIVHTLV